jgi:hypothetical protein
MKITATQANGKHYAEVRDGDRIVFRTQGYYTSRMALADAQCWVAFNGEGNTMNAGLEAARLAGLAMRAKMDAENTVTVTSGTHVLPWEMAYELRKPAPHPHNGFAGELGKRMLARQALRKECAALLSIPVAEVRDVVRQLRANKR